MQSDVAVGTNAISGTLNFIEGGLAQSGPLAGDGHFLALKFSTSDWNDFDKVEVGLDPSQGSGLVDIIPDPDKNGVFKITSTSQKFIVKTTKGTDVVTKEYSLADLVLTPGPVATNFFTATVYDGEGQFNARITGEGTETSYREELASSNDTDRCDIAIDSSTGWTITGLKINGSDAEVPEYSEGMYSFNYESLVLVNNKLLIEFTATHATKGTVTITLEYYWV